MLPILKDKALKAVYALLRGKSEQERRLLYALVNKLGIQNIRQLLMPIFICQNFLTDHPDMKAVVIDEVDAFLSRPHLGLRSSEADDIIEVQTPMLFQLVHSKNLNLGVQALMLLDKISSKNQIVALQQPPCGCLFLLSEVLKAKPPLWHMVLQNELADEDLKHFEDIVEEAENQTSTKVEKSENNIVTVHTNDGIDPDNESSQDKGVPPASESEDDVSDEADDLFIGGNSKNIEETNKIPDQTKQQSQESKMSSLPGGYNP